MSGHNFDTGGADLAFTERISTFSSSKAVFEASRCIECSGAPCVKACPVHVDIPGFTSKIKARDFLGADRTILQKCILPGTCARTCPSEELCVKSCCVEDLLGPVAIADLQRFAADYGLKHGVRESCEQKTNAKRIGVVGSGPAGLSAAAELVRVGHSVVVFESERIPGGALTYSIPSYRLPKDIVRGEIDYIRGMGVKFEMNTRIRNLKDLRERYDAIFLGVGLTEPVLLDIPGKELRGVVSGIDFLREINRSLMENRTLKNFTGKRVAVVGGGDLAMDAAVCAAKLGAKRVHLFYRRSFEEMPAAPLSLQVAKEAGVMFWTLTAPRRAIGDGQGNVSKLECIETKLGGTDKFGRRLPVMVEGTEFKVDVDYLVAAVGQQPGKDVIQLGVRALPEGTIIIDEKGRTSDPAVFAGGDVSSGGATVIQALADGTKAAESIAKYFT
jgi:glutamate synthase (NADPH/NADH) small chain